tara:strand:- start:354 stop:896 length:543 start_codon:yes stop_codon:yes gene_type:complete
MKRILLFSIILLISACAKPKSVLVCGDHLCINDKEAKQYFEENLSIEVQILNSKKGKKIDLVELNLKNENDTLNLKVLKKDITKKNIKSLSNQEIKEIKQIIKYKEKKKKIVRKDILNQNKGELKVTSKKNKSTKMNVLFNKDNSIDICTIVNKCSIDEISKYLIKLGKKQGFPDITIRE